ncbi:ExeA family protein [Desulfogranum marinum]|uniref:ExeA family protein n=1 Tax=Desulfogranum marinum TaxID=453220 RepID=UPI00196453F8|nr:AAA family ATPase [Desulfogranum marinum]MBM9515119.1 AAA family ATPase [Desulfogranum marinum]
MYLPFYDLNKAPFQSSFDPAFFWQGKKIHRLLKILKFDFERHTRISLVTGDPGCGKSSVIRAVLDSLDPSVLIALVQDSRLSVREFYDLTGHALQLPGPLPTRKIFHKQMLALLHKAEEQEKHVLLVLDEAQQLSPQLIEEIEAIIALATQELEGLSVCLVGQLDNAECLKGHLLTFFEKHDMVLHHLPAMTLEETSDYIRHRLQVAGSTRKIFTDDAIQEIHQHANGYPVQINNICDLALFMGESKQTTEIDAPLILASVDKLQFPTRRRGDVPKLRKGIDTAGKDESPKNTSKNTKPVQQVKTAEKQRISALEVFAKMDKDKEKQQPEPKQSIALPGLGLCLILVLGVGVYVYFNKWAKRPEGLPQIKVEQPQAQQTEKPVSQMSLASLPPDQGRSSASSSTTSSDQADDTLPIAQKKAPLTKTDNPENVLLQEDSLTPQPIPLLKQTQTAEENGEGDKLVMPQLQDQIEDLLQETTSDLLQEKPVQFATEQKKREEVVLLSPKENIPKNKQELPLPETGKRNQHLELFLAGGAFVDLNKNINKEQPDLKGEIKMIHSSLKKQKEILQHEPAPADVIDWLIKKKEQKVP